MANDEWRIRPSPALPAGSRRDSETVSHHSSFVIRHSQFLSWLLNLVLPGTGLILRRREWLGFLLALVFGISGNIALAGWLIAPLAVPVVMTGLAFLLAGLSWLAAQVLLHREAAAMRRQAAQLRALVDAARAALDRGDLESARLELDSGLALDDECAELYLLRARLCDLSGDE